MAKIPLLSAPNQPLYANSQDLVPLADIIDDIVMLKNGGACLVLESTSLNFGLLSEKEQEAVIASFAALINSLSFPIQILIRSQKKDISGYIHYLEESYNKMPEGKLKHLMADYQKFIIEITQKKNVLGKRFFMVVPFSPYELGLSRSSLPSFKHAGPLPYTKDFIYKKAKTALYPKKEHLIRQAARLGLRLTPLGRDELIKLYYAIYNPKVELAKSDISLTENPTLK
jgi:hypothetical protein